jgi:uncharacterized membrane protein YcaP (DUF421 family)
VVIMGAFYHISIELIVGFFALLILTKVVGKTQITQATPFDFISALVLGELVGNAIYDKEVGLGQILYSVTLWALLIFIVEKITLKMHKSRSVFESHPSIVIRDGSIDRVVMKKNNIDINQIQNLLREENIFSVREVAYAILEPDGGLSAIKKSQYAAPTRSELNLPVEPVALPVTLISDGIILKNNLDNGNYTEEWLMDQLKVQNFTDPKDVFFAEWRNTDGLFVQGYPKD